MWITEEITLLYLRDDMRSLRPKRGQPHSAMGEEPTVAQPGVCIYLEVGKIRMDPVHLSET